MSSVAEDPTLEQAPAGEPIGPYRLVRQLGQGGMGVVHLAKDPDGRLVAVKVLRPHVAYDPTARARLEREVTTLERVEHPGVAGMLDHDLQCDRPYLVTRYVPGPQLDDLIEERGPLTPRRLLTVAGCLAESLQAIHAVGVVHRDLKPGNVLVHEGRPVIIDFGIAQAADDLRLTATGLVIGTPGYLAPELIDGDPVTSSVDWWGWAATVALAATGRRPFGRGPFEVVLNRVYSGQADLEGVDPRLAPLLAASLSVKRADRPSPEEILTGLARYSEGRDALVRPETPLTFAPTALHTVVQSPPTAELPADPPAPVTRVAPAGPPDPTPEQVAALVPSLLPRRTPKPPQQPQPAQQPAPQPVQHPQPMPAVAPRSTTRSGSLAAVLLALVGLAALYPILTIVLSSVLIVLARTVDRSTTARWRRRQVRGGPGRSDSLVATLSSPWHVVTAALITVPCLIAPLTMGGIIGILAAAGFAATFGLDWPPLVSAAVASGALLGLVTCWWGPGGTSLRRGSHAIARPLLRTGWLRALAVIALLAVAAFCVAAVVAGADVSWAPLPDPFDAGNLPDRPQLPDLPGLPRIDLPFLGS